MIRSTLVLTVLLLSLWSCENQHKSSGENSTAMEIDTISIQTPNPYIKIDPPPSKTDKSLTLPESIPSQPLVFPRPAQSFELDGNRDTILKCEKGTSIHIKSNSFINASTGKAVKGKIDFEVKEYYDKVDMIFADLTTTSNSRLLESGGMLRLSATANGQQVKLKPGKVLEMEFGSLESQKEGMEVFQGERLEDAIINWSEVERENSSTGQVFSRVVPERSSSQWRFFYADSIISYLNQRFEGNWPDHIRGERNSFKASFIISQDGSPSNVKIEESELGHDQEDKLISAIGNQLSGFDEAKEMNFDSARVYMIGGWINEGLRFSKSYHIYTYIDQGNSRNEGINTSNSVVDTSSKVLFTVSNLGWINCDRYLRGNPRLYNLIVKVPGDFEDKVVGVFQEFNGIIPSTRYDFDKVIFQNIPLGEKISVLAFKKGNSELTLSYKKLDGYTTETEIEEPKAITKRKFRKTIESLSKS